VGQFHTGRYGMTVGTGKGKVIPLHAMKAHGGERKYGSCSFLTSALYGSEWYMAALYPLGKGPPVPTG
jgi:hypothetical protein